VFHHLHLAVSHCELAYYGLSKDNANLKKHRKQKNKTFIFMVLMQHNKASCKNNNVHQ